MELKASLETNGPEQRDKLASALKDADIRVLLMVLLHLTGELKWLEAPFAPARDVRLIPDASAGLPAEVQNEIRNAALEALMKPDTAPAVSDPGNDIIQRMMSVCLGEAVPTEYAPLIREEMGLISRDAKWPLSRRADENIKGRHVLIVGAGVSGLALGVSLKRLDIPFTIVEKNTNVGGTWYVNRYPGCGVDTPNHSYSYSFGARYPWSRYFSPREEVQDYLEQIASEFDIRRDIRFGTKLIQAAWMETEHCWRAVVETAAGEEVIHSNVLVSAIGQLSDPSVPNIAGTDDFRGPLFHSASWPEDLELHGKRLAVIGTGATAMQLVPTVAADETTSVRVFQRTAQWARPIPGYSERLSDGAQWLLRHVPFYAEWFRFNMFWRYGDGLLPFLRRDPTWPHQDRSVNRINERHRDEMLDFVQQQLKSRPDLIGKCIPSYPPYAKRILLDNGWYRTLLKPSVTLVTEPITCITADGIRTADGVTHGADVIVLATGFKVTEMASRLGIFGRSGVALAGAWGDDNPKAYLGLCVPGFPNFFCMIGPNSGPAHGGSVVFQAECQSRYITSCLTQMISRQIGSIEVRKDVLEEHVAAIDAEHEQLIWTHPGVETYYRNKHGRVFSVMPWRFVDYWTMTHDANLSDYLTVAAPSSVPVAAT